MRLDGYRAESRRLRANSRHDGQQIVVWMGAPGVGIGARGLRLFGPGGEAESKHIPPRLQQTDVLIAHAGVLQGARQIKAKVVRRFRHRRSGGVSLEASVAGCEKLCEYGFLLRLGNEIEPPGKNIDVLAEVFLRRRIRK